MQAWALIANPDLDVDSLLEYVKGPDFPTLRDDQWPGGHRLCLSDWTGTHSDPIKSHS